MTRRPPWTAATGSSRDQVTACQKNCCWTPYGHSVVRDRLPVGGSAPLQVPHHREARMTLVCITNDVKGLRPCTVRDRHTDFCDGVERRWVTDISKSLHDPERRWESHIVAAGGTVWPSFDALDAAWWGQTSRADVIRLELTDTATLTPRRAASLRNELTRVESNVAALLPKPCGGCLPRKAEHGLLCWSCWEKTRDALNRAVDVITHLHSVEKAQQHDNAGIRNRAGWLIPVPGTWRLADELITLLGHPEPGFPSTATYWEAEVIVERYLDEINPDAWVAREAGAEAAVRFHQAMQLALRQHPMEEYEHPIRNVRCPHCKRRSLLWKPPLAFTADDDNPDGRVRVICRTESCGMEMSQTDYATVADIEENIRRDATTRAAQKKAASAAGKD